jgi:riboflavin synthase
MFTGIVESTGRVQALVRRDDGARVEIAAGRIAAASRLGDSIAVDGACLTVTAIRGEAFAADLSAETLARTTLGGLRPGDTVNLERPLALGGRLGGHLVTGHVDAIGRIVERTTEGSGAVLRVGFPRELAPLLVRKGSVAVDGVSLTLAALDAETFAVALIPFTLNATTLPGKRTGAAVNLETDIIGKYVARFLEHGGHSTPAGGLSRAFLEEHGFA